MGTVLYNMLLMSRNACSGAVALTREISAHRPGSVPVKRKTFRTPVSNVNHFTSGSLDVWLIFDRSLRLLNKKNNELLCFLSNQLQLLSFLLVGGDTNNYFGDLNCHLAGRVLIPAVW